MNPNNFPLIFNSNKYGGNVSSQTQLYGEGVLKKDFDFQRLILCDELEKGTGTKAILLILPIKKNDNISVVYVEVTKLQLSILKRRGNLSNVLQTDTFGRTYRKYNLDQFTTTLKSESSVLNFEEGRKFYNERYDNCLKSITNTLIVNGLKSLLNIKMQENTFKLYIDPRNDEQYLISYLNNQFACSVKGTFRLLMEKIKSNLNSSTTTSEQDKIKKFMCLTTSDLPQLLANTKEEKTYSISGDEANKNLLNGRVLEIGGVELHAIEKMTLDENNDISNLFERMGTKRGTYAFCDTSKLLGIPNPKISIFDMEKDRYVDINVAKLISRAHLNGASDYVFDATGDENKIMRNDFFDLAKIYKSTHDYTFNLTANQDTTNVPKIKFATVFDTDPLKKKFRKYIKDFTKAFANILIEKTGYSDCVDIVNRCNKIMYDSLTKLTAGAGTASGAYATFINGWSKIPNSFPFISGTSSDYDNYGTTNGGTQKNLADTLKPYLDGNFILTYTLIHKFLSIDTNLAEYNHLMYLYDDFKKFLKIVDIMYDMYNDIFNGDLINKKGVFVYNMGKREEFFDQIILGYINSAKTAGITSVATRSNLTGFDNNSTGAYSLMTFDKICQSIIYNMSLRKSYFEKFCKIGLPIPFSFLLFRNNITFNSQVVCGTVAGGLVGNSVLGFKDIIEGVDMNSLESVVKVNAGMATVLMQEDMVHNIHNSVVRYVDGMSATIKRSSDSYKKGDIYCVAIGYKERNIIPKHISITGRFNNIFDTIVDNKSKIHQYESTTPHYSTSEYYNKLYGFGSNTMNPQSFDDFFGENSCGYNNIVSLETFKHGNQIVIGDSVIGNAYAGVGNIFKLVKYQQIDNDRIFKDFPGCQTYV